MDERKWYYVRDGQTVGLVARDDLRDLARQGRFHASDLVWCDGNPDIAAAAIWVSLVSLVLTVAATYFVIQVLREVERRQAAKSQLQQ